MAGVRKISQDASDRIAFYRQNPTVALRDMLNVNTTWWQRNWINNANNVNYSMIIGGRGSGKTYFLANNALLDAILYSNQKVGIISNSYRQAHYVFNELIRILDNAPSFIRDSITKGPSSNPITSYVEFANGSRIEAQPLGDGQKIVGARYYTLLVDEFTKIPQEILDVIVMPMMQINKNPVTGMFIPKKRIGKQKKSQNKIIFTGTAGFQINDAYKKLIVFKDGMNMVPDEYYFNTVTIDDIRTVEGFLNEGVIRLEFQTMSPVRFLMENYGIWAKDTDGFFPLQACEAMRDNSVRFQTEGTDGKAYVMGIDTAKSDDNFAVVIMEASEPRRVVHVFAENNNTAATSESIDRVRKLERKFNILKINIDSRGGGSWLADELSKKYSYIDNSGNLQIRNGLTEKMELVSFNHPLLDEMNWKLRAAIDNGLIKVPNRVMDDAPGLTMGDVERLHNQQAEIDLMIDELESIIVTQLSSGMRFDTAQKTQKKDRYSALMLANWAVEQLQPSRRYTQFPSGFWL